MRTLLIIGIISSVVISVGMLSKAIKTMGDHIFLVIACISVGVNVLWPFISKYMGIEWVHYPFDLIIALLAFSAFWFRLFFRMTVKTEQLAEKLKLENKRKDEFLVNTSHELRNPLHVITNMSQSVLDDPINQVHKEHRNCLEITVKVGKQMSLMLDDLIDITRLKEKTVQLKFAHVNVHSIVAGVADMATFMLEGKPVKLNVQIPDILPSVYADENKLTQILFNLVHNAVKFTDEGTIMIRANLHKNMVRIHVEDTGIGIKQEALERLFQPYEQASIHATRASGGFGLGLNIVKQLVDMHGGTLIVDSKEGKGSTFSFTLPSSSYVIEELDTHGTSKSEEVEEMIAVTNDMTEPALKSNTTKKNKRKLLIVDDDYVNLKVLIHLLEAENYDITAVTNANQAIKQIESDSYDLVISDVMMPKISGYELTRRIRERFTISELPILLLTARSRRSEDMLTGFRAGANDYVSKPVDADELRARVRALTDLKVSNDEHVRMEGTWLQSQIQPHFLFNTLNSIAALGMVETNKMQALLQEFSNYLRLSMDFKNSEPVVHIDHELSLVRSYLYIEQQRFGTRLHVQWELEPDLDFYLPPLSIQPIVENAVQHGVLTRQEGGTVCIRIEQFSDDIQITVIDDGKGMNEEELEQLFIVA